MPRSARTQHRPGVLLPLPGGSAPRITTATARLLGAGLLVAIGLIHLILAPQYYPAAAYVGVLFYATCAAAWLAAAAIAVGVRGAWLVGGLLAAGSFAALFLASTVGLPGFSESLGAPWAVLSLVLEGLFVGLYATLVLLRRNLLLAPPATSGPR